MKGFIVKSVLATIGTFAVLFPAYLDGTVTPIPSALFAFAFIFAVEDLLHAWAVNGNLFLIVLLYFASAVFFGFVLWPADIRIWLMTSLIFTAVLFRALCFVTGAKKRAQERLEDIIVYKTPAEDNYWKRVRRLPAAQNKILTENRKEFSRYARERGLTENQIKFLDAFDRAREERPPSN